MNKIIIKSVFAIENLNKDDYFFEIKLNVNGNDVSSRKSVNKTLQKEEEENRYLKILLSEIFTDEFSDYSGGSVNIRFQFLETLHNSYGSAKLIRVEYNSDLEHKDSPDTREYYYLHQFKFEKEIKARKENLESKS